MSEYIVGTLAELNNKYATKQPKLVNNILEETTVLPWFKWQPSSHGLWNNYEEVTNIKSADFVDMNSPLPTMGMDTKLKKVDLAVMGGEIFCPEDKAQMFGSAESYFAMRTPALLKDAGIKTEKKLIYDNIARFAKDNGKLVSADDGQGQGYSMYAIRQIEGENIGLYSPQGFKNGAMLDVAKINGGQLYKNEDGVLGYGLRFKGYFGFQLANKNGVSGIVNIDATHIPTEEQIDQMLVDARANPSTTVIICHPKVLSFLNKYKGNILQATSGDKDIDRTYMAWNGIKFLTSYNFINGTEKKVTL